MNLFRSEEHARRWAQYDPAFEQMLRPLAAYLERFSGEMFRNRHREYFVSWRVAQQQR